MTTESDAEADVRAAMADFDRAFAAGDARHLAELFADDARLLLLHSAAIEGRAAIRPNGPGSSIASIRAHGRPNPL